MKGFNRLAFSLAATAVGAASAAFAAPVNTPFLSVDFNGSAGGAASSPTQSGFSGLGFASPVGASSVSGTFSGVTVTVAPNSAATGGTFTSRDRGANGSASYSDLLRDFALELRDTGHALGYSYLAISISGLSHNTD